MTKARKNSLFLEKLEINNFRCFPRLEMEFHPRLTVILAENGSGKTALIEAISCMLNSVLDQILPMRVQLTRLIEADIRQSPEGNLEQEELKTKIKSFANISERQVYWYRSINSNFERRRNYSKNFKAQIAKCFDEKATLPLISQYGINRMRNIGFRRGYKNYVRDTKFGSLVAYKDCLKANASVKKISDWFEEHSHVSGSTFYGREVENQLDLVEGVRNAVNKILEPVGWSNLDWDKENNELTMHHNDFGRLPLIYLSDGIRIMTMLVADIAIRCAQLNSEFGENAAKNTPGILVVDELCLHLHPTWQQTVLESLLAIFPKLQVIVSTHSPFLVSTVHKESVKTLRYGDTEFSVDPPIMQTRGADVNQVIHATTDTDIDVDLKETKMLKEYQNLIQNGKGYSQRAKTLKDRLINHFGSGHPRMLECDGMLLLYKYRIDK